MNNNITDEKGSFRATHGGLVKGLVRGARVALGSGLTMHTQWEGSLICTAPSRSTGAAAAAADEQLSTAGRYASMRR